MGDAYHYAELDYDSESNTDHAQFRQYGTAQGRWESPDPYSGSYDPFFSQSLNRCVYSGNNPLSFTDSSGLDCSVVVGGITQTPNTPGTSAQHQFATGIGGIEAYPYAGGSVLGGALDVELQSFRNTNASYVAAAAFTAAAQGGSFNIFTFSGGFQATLNGLSLVSPNVRGLVNNITSISPGEGNFPDELPQGTGQTTVMVGGSVADFLASGGMPGIPTGCGHNANCAFSDNKPLLNKLAGGGKRCVSRGTFVPQGQVGGVQVNSYDWSYIYLFLYGSWGDNSSVTASWDPNNYTIPTPKSEIGKRE